MSEVRVLSDATTEEDVAAIGQDIEGAGGVLTSEELLAAEAFAQNTKVENGVNGVKPKVSDDESFKRLILAAELFAGHTK